MYYSDRTTRKKYIYINKLRIYPYQYMYVKESPKTQNSGLEYGPLSYMHFPNPYEMMKQSKKTTD
jgi:hypothetical protein